MLCSETSPNKDDLPLVDSVHGLNLLSQLCSLAGNGTAQDANRDTLSVQQSEDCEVLPEVAKFLIDEQQLKRAWDSALRQGLAIDKNLSDIQNKFAALKASDQEALKSNIRNNPILVVNDIIFHVWYKACLDLDNAFREDKAKKMKFRKVEFFEYNLFAVVMLPFDHPLVYKSESNRTVSDKIFGCSRLAKYHQLLSKIAKEFVRTILSIVCPEQPQSPILHSRAFCQIKERVRDKLRQHLLSDKFSNNAVAAVLRKQWGRFEEVRLDARAAASAAAGTIGDLPPSLLRCLCLRRRGKDSQWSSPLLSW